MKSPRIVIIGAGASGVAAATKLCENGFTNVTILEAENRIGGRIRSVRLGEDVVDLGAQVCRENGLVHDLVKDLLEARNAGFELYHSKRGRMPDDFMSRLMERLSVFYDQKVEGISWQQHLDEQYDRCVLDHFEGEQRELLVNECNLFIQTMMKFVTCTIPLSDGGETFGEPLLSFQLVWKTSTFETLFDCLIKEGLNIQEKIVLNAEVSEIDWKDGIKLRCSNGSSYAADCVVVTVPLGVLKKRAIIFRPPLPKEKEEAIDLMKFTSSCQVIVYFPTKWWGNNDIFFAWTQEDMKIVDFNKGPSKNGLSWVTEVSSYVVSPHHKNCLTVVFGGDRCKEIEEIDDETWLEGVHYLNGRFLAKNFPNVCKPTKMARMNWFGHPHFGGTVTTETMEGRRRGLGKRTLATPLLAENGKPRVLFAGEAANDGPLSFVNSALYSGYREAERIIDFYKNEQ